MTARSANEAVFSAIRAQWEGAALMAAHKAGVFRAFAHAQALTMEEMCKATRISARAAEALVSTLVATKWLVRADAPFRLKVTEKARALVDGDAETIGYLNLHADLRDFWAHLEDQLVASDLRDGEGFNKSEDPRLVEEYLLAMNALGEVPAHELWQKVNVSGAERVLDLGGGGGVYGRVLREMHPGCHVSVVERPAVCETVRTSAVLRDEKMEYISGSYVEYRTAATYELILCCNVIHHESRVSAEALLRTAKACLASHGRVVLVDYFAEDGDTYAPPGFGAMLLAMSPEGRIHKLRDVVAVAERMSLQLETKWSLSTGLKACAFRSSEGGEIS